MATDDLLVKSLQAVLIPEESQAVVAESPIPNQSENQASAEIAVDTTESVTENTQAPEAVATEAKPTTSNEPYNYWEDLAQKSEGLVKDEDTFKSVLEKYKEHGTLVTQKEELEKNQWKPANDYVATFDKLIKDGATADQIKAFVKLNEYGNIDDLQPFEAKVAKMVLIDGYSEEMAKKILNRDFNLTQFDETDADQKDEADIMREQLRVSSKNDLEAIKQYRKELSVVHNPEKEQAEQAKLTEIANLATYNKTVEQEAPKLAKLFPPKLTYELKVGDETIPFEDSIDQAFLDKQAPDLYQGYYRDSLDPINGQTLEEANSFVYGEYLKANIGKMLENAYKKGLTTGTEKTTNKYENLSGLPRAEENVAEVITNEDGMTQYYRKLFGKDK